MLFRSDVIETVSREFEEMTGRKYSFFEEYKMDDAEYVIVCMNSTAGTVKNVVDKLRGQGIKAGLLKIRVYRPFPIKEVAKALSNAKKIAVLDKVPIVGHTGGPLFEDVVSAMFVNDVHVPTINYSYGIGGRDVTEKHIESVFEDLQKLQGMEDPIRYLGLMK